MLILTRRPGESIRIGETIVLTVVQVRGQLVRLGFVAPADVKILREELEARPLESANAGG